MDKLEQLPVFATTVYVIKKDEYLDAVRKVSDRYLEEARAKSEPGLIQMTATFAHEPELKGFAEYVSQTAWNILSSQGYAMDHFVTYFTEMWTQEHKSFSHMDQHVHGHGAQISAFYFLDTPPNSCQMMIFDPRPAKAITNLPLKDDKTISAGSQHIVLTPSPGMIIFTNAWLPHSFTKNFSEHPMRFVHMNLSVTSAPQTEPNVEVV